jgi:hypothetical protein
MHKKVILQLDESAVMEAIFFDVIKIETDSKESVSIFVFLLVS